MKICKLDKTELASIKENGGDFGIMCAEKFGVDFDKFHEIAKAIKNVG